MYPSALQLDRYFITDLTIKANPEFGLDDNVEDKISMDDIEIEAFTLPNNENPSRLYCELKLELPEKLKTKYPYSFEMVIVGFFQIAPDSNPEMKDFFVNVNAPSLLYSAARELLATLTSRGPYWPLWLPTTSFFNPQDGKTKVGRKKTNASSAKKKPRK